MVAITLPFGRLAGQSDNELCAFRGIPYALAPVGSLRFRSPAPLPAWSSTLDATAYGPAPLQTLSPVSRWIYDTPAAMSETCLYLNVFTPSIKQKHPVVIWLHGGAWRTGHGGVAATEGSHLARAGQIVVVTVNSRQGALGWLGHPDLIDDETGTFANWGLQDQIEALRWVKRNIAFFGGDPENITVVGQSAGGQTIAVVAQHYAQERLFDKAVLQSPALFGAPRFMESGLAFAYCERVARQLGCTVKQLREVPAKTLHEEELRLSLDKEMQRVLRGHRYLPFVDGRVIKAWPYQSDLGQIPIMIGTTRNETNFFFNLRDPDGTSLANDIPLTEDALISRVGDFCGKYYPFQDRPDPRRLVEHFRTANGRKSNKDIFLDITTDVDMRGYAFRLAQMQAERAPVYFYEFGQSILPPGEGVPHTSEIPFLFGTFSHPYLAAKVGSGPESARLSAAMMQAWSSFAHCGAPALPGKLAWPRLDMKDPKLAVFGGADLARVVAIPRRAELSIWPKFAQPIAVV